MKQEFLWCEKYRPKTVADCILPNDLKSTFQAMVDQGEIPNLLLSGGPGCGKTTVAKAMLDQLDADWTIINASLKGNMDTLRNEISNFASAMSFKGKRRYMILDEADYLTHFVQPALRNFLEEFSTNCGFILTANYRNRIIKELHSRCSCIEFNFSKEDKPTLCYEFFNRVKSILTTEKIEYDKNVIIEIIKAHFPDYRRILNELQRYSVNGKIDSGILQHFQSASITNLISHMKDKNYTKVRQWCAENSNDVFRTFYDEANKLFTPDYIPMLVLTLAKYQYQANFVLDQEINTAACFAEIMVESSWRNG